MTPETLRQHDGTDPALPILVSVQGVVYDVSTGRSFYGPGGAYHVFAGRECARALALQSLDEVDITGDVSGLSGWDLDRLQDWIRRFEAKYPRVT